MYEYKAKITKVIDGDTIRADIDLGFDIILYKQTIRLYGVDAPESRTRDLEEKYYGNLAKDFLKRYIKNNNIVILKTKLDKKGKFGRILGEIYLNNLNLNQLLIDENLAVSYHGQSKNDIIKEHLYNRDRLNERGFKYS